MRAITRLQISLLSMLVASCGGGDSDSSAPIQKNVGIHATPGTVASNTIIYGNYQTISSGQLAPKSEYFKTFRQTEIVNNIPAAFGVSTDSPAPYKKTKDFVEYTGKLAEHTTTSYFTIEAAPKLLAALDIKNQWYNNLHTTTTTKTNSNNADEAQVGQKESSTQSADLLQYPSGNPVGNRSSNLNSTYQGVEDITVGGNLWSTFKVTVDDRRSQAITGNLSKSTRTSAAGTMWLERRTGTLIKLTSKMKFERMDYPGIHLDLEVTQRLLETNDPLLLEQRVNANTGATMATSLKPQTLREFSEGELKSLAQSYWQQHTNIHQPEALELL